MNPQGYLPTVLVCALSGMEKVLSSVLTSLVKKGTFGDVEFMDIKCENDKDIGSQFGSSLSFVNLIVKNHSGESKIPLLIKTPMPQRIEDGRVQFMMESLMYMEVLPGLGFQQVCYPKIYYSNVNIENPEENMLIFENVKYKGYRNSNARTFLDYEHISLAMKTIAKFHSLSYILKNKNLGKFHELKDNIKKYSFDPKLFSKYNIPVYAAIERGVRRFEKENGPDEVLEDLLKPLKNSSNIRGLLSLPEEPFDVICHGDFCNNNVMYKYNEDESPVACILYDFQLSTYGNIATELVFFLYMHTNSDCREKYWDSFLKIYWDTLRESVPHHIELPTYEDFLEDFGTKAVLGYIICSFFLPMVMDPKSQFWGHLPIEEQVPKMRTISGDEGEKAIADIVSHMHQKKYIHKFLNYLKTKSI